MKKMLIIILVLPIFLFAQNEKKPVKIEITDTFTILDLSHELKIPVKKLKECLKIDQDVENNSTLVELNIDNKAINKACSVYDKTKLSFFFSIMITGMVIVFISLIIIGAIINLLKHLEAVEKYKNKLSTLRIQRKSQESEPDLQLSNSSVIAAIAAVFLYEKDVQEQDKMILTWKRAPTSSWKVTRILPNQEFVKRKR